MSSSAAETEAAPAAARTGAGYLASTLKHGAIYGLGTVLAKAVGFLMLPIYTRLLTPADYGVLELLSMTGDAIGILTGVGLTWAITRYWYYYEDPADQSAVVSSAVLLLAGFSAVAGALTLSLAEGLSAVVLGSAAQAGLVRLAIIGMFLGTFLEIPLAFLRARQASTRVVVAGLARLVLALSLNIIFVVVLRRGVAGVLYSTIISSALVGGFLLVDTLRATGLRFRRPIAAKLLAYGAPIVAVNLASFVIHYSDRYLLRVYGSLESVGLYSLAYKFAMLISVFIAAPFAQIWAPKALEIDRAEGEAGLPILRRIITYYNVVLVAGALAIALLAGDAIRIIASAEFHAAAGLIPLLCLAMLFFGYRQISYIGAAVRERSDIMAVGTAVAAAVMIAANFALIPRWGATGAAVATLAAFATEFVVVLVRAERVYPLRYPLAALCAPVLLAAALYGAVELALAPGAPLMVRIPVKLAALGVFAALAALAVTGRVRPAAWWSARASWSPGGWRFRLHEE